MTYNEFKSKYNNKYVDYDGCYSYQCWDLAQQYFTECLGVPSWVLSGCDNVCNMLKEPKLSDLLLYFDEVSPTAMQPGDVAIWSANHIAIFDHWDGKDVWYFSQNPNKCQVMIIYMNGLRVFRLKSKFKTVARDENKYQIEFKVPQLNCRVKPSTGAESKGFAKQGIYNYTDKTNANGYDWYNIGIGWIAYTADWCDLYPKKAAEVPIEEPKVEGTPSVEPKEENNVIVPEEPKSSENDIQNEQKTTNIFIRIIQLIINVLKKLVSK